MFQREKPVVAHNAAFDARLLQQTGEKQGLKDWKLPVTMFCSMTGARSHIVRTDGKRKAPSNVECFKYLCGRDPDMGQLHDAMACARQTDLRPLLISV